MTVPVRSTTRAVTDRFRLPRAWWPALAAVLVILAAVAVQRLSLPSSAPNAVVGKDDSARSVSLVNDGGPAGQALLDRVSAEAGSAVAAVEAFWGADWGRAAGASPEPILIVATGTPAQFAARAGADGAERADTAAVAVADRVDPASRTVEGERIVLAPGAAAMSPHDLRIVLRHELFHYAARADTAPVAPRWLTEGVADYVARPAPPAPIRLDTSRLPSDAEFTGTPAELSAAYDRAWLFARFVADRYGAPALRLLYLRAAGIGHADTATALRDVLGADPDDVLARWREWAH